MAWGGPYDAGKGAGKSDGKDEPSDNLYVAGLPPGTDDDFIKALFASYGTVTSCRVLPQKSPGSSMHALVRFSSVEEATTIKDTVTGGMVDGSTEPLKCTFASKPSGGGSWGKDGGSWGKDGGSWGKGGNSWGKGMSWGDGGKGDGGMGDGGKADGGKADGGKADGGKGKGGKGGKGKMDQVMEAFQQAQCLPGCDLGNDHNNVYIAGLPSDCTDLHLFKLFSPFGAIPSKGVFTVKNPDGSCKGYGFVNYVDISGLKAATELLNGAQLPDGSILKVSAKLPGHGGKGQEKGGF